MNRSPDPVDVHIGQSIMRVRVAKGWNQTTLGVAVGVTFQQIQKYEKGANRVSGSRLQKIAECFGMEPGDFFPKQGEALARSTGSASFSQTSQGARMIQAIDAMDQARRRSLMGVIDALSGGSEPAAA